MGHLLRIPPQGWQIRESTLVQIADLFPTMDATIFTASLVRLVEQANTSKTPIRNYNGWLKESFVKNGGALVTRREICLWVEHGTPGKSRAPRASTPPPDHTQELAVLRLYVHATDEQRSAINTIAAAQAAPLLKTLSADKHHGILGQARVEATRAYFGEKTGEKG